MVERKVILKNKTGLHARPASELVAFAKELPCKVYIEHNGKKAAADRILQLLTLGAKEGHGDVFPGFSLCFLYPGSGAGEVGIQKHQWTWKKKKKSLYFQAADQERGSLVRQQTSDNNYETRKKHHR